MPRKEGLLGDGEGVVARDQRQRRCNRRCVSNVTHLLQLTLWFGLTIFGIAQHKVASPLIAAGQMGNATWATLPVAITDVGGIVFSIPVSLLVKRIGWRRGFVAGGAAGMASALICFAGTYFANFYVMCVGSLFISIWNVCGYYVRFAAAESVDESWDTGRVISYVLVSSAVTGSFGPQMVAVMNDFVLDYFGVYIEVAGIAAICMAIAICMRTDHHHAKGGGGGGGARPKAATAKAVTTGDASGEGARGEPDKFLTFSNIDGDSDFSDLRGAAGGGGGGGGGGSTDVRVAVGAAAEGEHAPPPASDQQEDAPQHASQEERAAAAAAGVGGASGGGERGKQEDAEAAEEEELPPRPVCRILCSPVTVVAILSEMVGMFVMLLVMTATPVAMHGSQRDSFHFPLEQTTLTVQVHIVCMFLPGLVTGDIVRIIGTSNTILGGTLCYAGSVIVGILNHSEAGFMASLVLLGIGWNWTYVGGTRLLITAYRPNESKVIQGVNETLAQAAAALGALLAGIMLGHTGWDGVLFTAVPAIALNLGGWVFFQAHQCWARRAARAAAGSGALRP